MFNKTKYFKFKYLINKFVFFFSGVKSLHVEVEKKNNLDS